MYYNVLFSDCQYRIWWIVYRLSTNSDLFIVHSRLTFCLRVCHNIANVLYIICISECQTPVMEVFPMKKGFSFTLIAMLIVLSVVLGVLYLSNNQEKSRKIEVLSAELADREKMIQDLDENSALHTSEIRSLKQELSEKDALLSQQDKQIRSLSSDISLKDEQIQELSSGIASRDVQITAQTDQLGKQAAAIDEYAASIKENASRIASLSDEAEQKDSLIKELNNSLSGKDSQIDALNADLETKTAEILALTEEINNKNLQIESLSALISAQPGVTETTGNDAAVSEERIRELESLLNEKDAVIADLKLSLADKNLQIPEQQETIRAEAATETKQDEGPLLASQLPDPAGDQDNQAVPETDPHPARIAELESQVSGLESENASLTASLSEKAAELDKLSSEVSASSSRISELEAVLSEKDEQILSLSGDCTDRETRIRELEAGLKDSTDTVSSLKEKTDILSEQVSVLTKDLSAKETQIQELQEKLGRQTELAFSLQTDLSAKEEQILQLSADLTLNNEKIETLEADVTHRDSRIEDLNNEVTSRDNTIQSLSDDLSDKNDEVNQLKEDILSTSGESERLKTGISTRDEMITSLKTENSSLEEQQLVYSERIEDLQNLFIDTFVSSSGNSLSLSEDSGIQVIKRFRIRDTDSPNVHKTASLSSRVIGHAKASVEYEVLDIAPNGMYKIRLENGKEGWIHPAVGTLKILEFDFDQDAP